MSKPFFSLIVPTCRDAYPMPLHENKHIFQLIVENLVAQTFKSFELIVVDLLWDHRHQWFQENYPDLPFPVLHIPDKSSVFKDLGLQRICSSRNTGLIFARGACTIYSDDCQHWSPDALEHLHKWGKKGFGATVRLWRDVGEGPYEVDSRWAAHNIAGTNRTAFIPASNLGYFGGSLSMAPTQKFVEINGWDEMFDGSAQLEDTDMSKRLGAAGLKMALEGHPRCIEYEHKACSSLSRAIRNVSSKCNGAWGFRFWNNMPQRIEANRRVMTDEEVKGFIEGQCVMLKQVDGQDKCGVSNHPCLDRFANKEMIRMYQDMRLILPLGMLRENATWENAHHFLGPL